MRTNELIRTVNGAEVPAAGRWTIPTSHVGVAFSARAGLRGRQRGRPRSVTGTVDVSADPFRLELELSLDASSRAGDGPSLGRLLGDPRLAAVVIRSFVVEPTADGVWRTCGVVEFDGVSRPVPIDIQYCGVYPAADEARAWFVVKAELREGVTGPRRSGPVELVADILAVGPTRDHADAAESAAAGPRSNRR